MNASRPARLIAPALVVVSVCLALSQPASGRRTPREGAAASDAQTQQKAEQALQAGRAALEARDLKGAYERAVESFRYAASPEALLLLGRIALAEGRGLDARDLCRRYLADPGLESDPQSPDQAEAQRIADDPRSELAHAQLRILGDRGTQVFIDGRLVGALPLSRPLLVGPGGHKVALVRTGSRLEDEVKISAGRFAEVRINVATRSLIISELPGVVFVGSYSGIIALEQQRLGQALDEAVQAERLSLLPGDPARGGGASGPCASFTSRGSAAEERPCLLDLATRSDADYVLRLRVNRDPQGVKLAAELLDTAMADTASRIDESCAGCSTEQAAQKLASLFRTLYKRAIERPRGRIEVRSDPAGASLFLDGELRGRTPFAAATWAGVRKLKLQLAGHQDHLRDVEIADGTTATIDVNLEPPPIASPVPLQTKPPLARPLWRIITGSSLLGTGLLVAVIGVQGLSLDGSCAVESFSTGGANTRCEAIYVTKAPGGALLGIGSALAIGGALLIAIPSRPPR